MNARLVLFVFMISSVLLFVDYSLVNDEFSQFEEEHHTILSLNREIGNVSEKTLFDLYFKGAFPNSYLTNHTSSQYGVVNDISREWYLHKDNYYIGEYCKIDMVNCHVVLGGKAYFISKLYFHGEVFSNLVSWRYVDNIEFFGFFSVCNTGAVCSKDSTFLYFFILTLTILMVFSYLRTYMMVVRKRHLDKLSGLKRRDSFKAHKLDQRVKALCFLDIDHFKNINDTYGHDIGDEAIKAFANCLKENIRDKDVAFRWGGEEFLVIIRGKVDENIDVYNILERLRASVEAMDIDGVPQFTVSIGYCHYDSNIDAKELIKQADLALYESKRTGRNKVSEYKNSMSDK